MDYKKFGTSITALLFAGLFTINANAAVMEPTFDFVFNFTGECDDCAFNGNPRGEFFNPLNDGLTETVTATLSLTGVSMSSEGVIDYRGAGDVSFTYNGSSLINPFTIFDPFVFTTALLPSGQVQTGSEFIIRSSQNAANPDVSFEFPNFCTALGQQFFEEGCGGIGLVQFLLDSTGNFSVSGTLPFDVGFGGELTPVSAVPVPAAMWLFGTGLIGLLGVVRRKKSV